MKPIKKILLIFSIAICSFFSLLLNDTNKKNTKKIYVSPQQLLEGSFKLAKLIFESNFRPTFLIALWCGGAPIGIAITEYFSYKETPINNHTAIRVTAYNGDKLKKEVKVFNLDHVIKTIKSDDKLLIVDDVVDSGRTINKVLEKIKTECDKNTPRDIRTATVYYKPQTASITPDYYLYETDSWIIFPHEIKGLTIKEIASHKGVEISNILK